MSKTILLVNDESQVRAAIRSLLPEINNKILEAPDGREGLLLAVKHRPDLIILDIVMPGLDGYTVLVRLREDRRTASIPVAIFTAHQREIDRQIALELGAADFISLDEKGEKIKGKIEALLGRPG